jgi:hypothetical protein
MYSGSLEPGRYSSANGVSMPEAVIREPSAKDLNLAFFVFFPFDFRLKFSAPQIDAAASAIDLLHREVSEKRYNFKGSARDPKMWMALINNAVKLIHNNHSIKNSQRTYWKKEMPELNKIHFIHVPVSITHIFFHGFPFQLPLVFLI